MCSEILGELHQLNLPKVKPIWVDLTDAGPGVGVSNNEVKFREAELARAHRSEYRYEITSLLTPLKVVTVIGLNSSPIVNGVNGLMDVQLKINLSM